VAEWPDLFTKITKLDRQCVVLRNHLVQRVCAIIDKVKQADRSGQPVSEAWVVAFYWAVRTFPDGVDWIIQFLDKSFAGAFEDAFGCVDAAVVPGFELALQRLISMLEHRGIGPMTAKCFNAGIKIAHQYKRLTVIN